MSTDETTPKKESKKEIFVKDITALARYEIVGIFALLSVGLLGIAGTYLGISTNLSSGVGIAETAKTLNYHLILWMVFNFIAVTGIFLFWSKLSAKMKDAKTAEQNMEHDHGILKTIRNFRIVPAILCGAFISLIVFAIVEIVWVISGVDLTNPGSIIHAFRTGSIIAIGATIGSIAVIGYLVPKLSAFYEKFREKISKYNKRI